MSSSFKDYLANVNKEPAMSWPELGNSLVQNTAYALPPALGISGLAGAGAGALGGALVGNMDRGAAIGGGAGIGGAGGMALGSILGNIAGKLGGSYMKLSPEHTGSLMRLGDQIGSIGGAGLGAIGGGIMGKRISSPAEKQSKLMRKAALHAIFPNSPAAHTGYQVAEAAKANKDVVPYTALGSALGGGAGYLLGDPVAGAGAGAGFTLGGAAGNIVGTGLGSIGGMALGRAGGVKGEALKKLMDQWGHGGGQVGQIVGGLGGGLKGVQVARQIANEKEGSAKPRIKKAYTTGPRLAAFMKSPSNSPNNNTAIPESSFKAGPSAAPSPESAFKAGPTLGAPTAAAPGLMDQLKNFKAGPGLQRAALLGLGGIGAASLGSAAIQGLHGSARSSSASDIQNSERSRNHDFLMDQHGMEMRRQEAMLRHMSYPGLYGSGGGGEMGQ